MRTWRRGITSLTPSRKVAAPVTPIPSMKALQSPSNARSCPLEAVWRHCSAMESARRVSLLTGRGEFLYSKLISECFAEGSMYGEVGAADFSADARYDVPADASSKLSARRKERSQANHP
jgi:hypothetical protein